MFSPPPIRLSVISWERNTECICNIDDINDNSRARIVVEILRNAEDSVAQLGQKLQISWFSEYTVTVIIEDNLVGFLA